MHNIDDIISVFINLQNEFVDFIQAFSETIVLWKGSYLLIFVWTLKNTFAAMDILLFTSIFSVRKNE